MSKWGECVEEDVEPEDWGSPAISQQGCSEDLYSWSETSLGESDCLSVQPINHLLALAGH